MDINCGPVIDGEATLAELGQRIFEQMLPHGSGGNEFVPWQVGLSV